MKFTPRQKQLVELLAAGYQAKEAAASLGVGKHRAMEMLLFARRANDCTTTGQLLYRYGQWVACGNISDFLNRSNAA